MIVMQKIIITGNLGKDAEKKELESGRIYVNFNVAVNSYKGKGEEKKQSTQWYSVSYFVNSEAIIQYLKKGAKVVVCGSLELDVFKSEKTGQMFVNANVLASDVEIVGFVDTEPAPASVSQKQVVNNELPPLPEEMPDNMPY